MRHGIHDVIGGDPQGGLRELFVILRVVGVFPGVAQVHVVADGDHESAMVVVDAAPNGGVAVLFVGATAP